MSSADLFWFRRVCCRIAVCKLCCLVIGEKIELLLFPVTAYLYETGTHTNTFCHTRIRQVWRKLASTQTLYRPTQTAALTYETVQCTNTVAISNYSLKKKKKKKNEREREREREREKKTAEGGPATVQRTWPAVHNP